MSDPAGEKQPGGRAGQVSRVEEVDRSGEEVPHVIQGHHHYYYTAEEVDRIKAGTSRLARLEVD
jgi:hypothetical protein